MMPSVRSTELGRFSELGSLSRPPKGVRHPYTQRILKETLKFRELPTKGPSCLEQGFGVHCGIKDMKELQGIEWR